ncbi:hypothetical protein KVT40_003401 [Elsinoe batatas]|uniref:Uncharacterized protein n=1 Tax=Elsinoe batatas TaxID=2601811 RepID=A0A8K0PH11_9PEZI|nr:hypothetical protein KVT40_003401 [Elsinoe batatas]
MRRRTGRSVARTSSASPTPVHESTDSTNHAGLFNMEDVSDSDSDHETVSTLPSIPTPEDQRPLQTFPAWLQRTSSTEVGPSHSPERLMGQRQDHQVPQSHISPQQRNTERSQRWPRPPTPPPESRPGLQPLTTLRRSATTQSSGRPSRRTPTSSQRSDGLHSSSSPALFDAASIQDHLAHLPHDTGVAHDQNLHASIPSNSTKLPAGLRDRSPAATHATPALDIPNRGRDTRPPRRRRSDSPRPDSSGERPTMVRDMDTGQIREMTAQDPPRPSPGVFSMSPLMQLARTEGPARVAQVNERLHPVRISDFEAESPPSAGRSRSTTPSPPSTTARPPRNHRSSRLSVDFHRRHPRSREEAQVRDHLSTSRNRRYASGEDESDSQIRAVVRHEHALRTSFGAEDEPVTTTPSPQPQRQPALNEASSGSPPEDMMTENLEPSLPRLLDPVTNLGDQSLPPATQAPSSRRLTTLEPPDVSTDTPVGIGRAHSNRRRRSTTRSGRRNTSLTSPPKRQRCTDASSQSRASRPGPGRVHTAPIADHQSSHSKGPPSTGRNKPLPARPTRESRYVPHDQRIYLNPQRWKTYSRETRDLEAAGMERPLLEIVRSFNGAVQIVDTSGRARPPTPPSPLEPSQSAPAKTVESRSSPSAISNRPVPEPEQTEDIRRHQQSTARAANATEALPSRHSSISGSDNEVRTGFVRGHRRGESNVSNTSDATIRGAESVLDEIDIIQRRDSQRQNSVSVHDRFVLPSLNTNTHGSHRRRQPHTGQAPTNGDSSEPSPATGQSTSSFASQQGFESTTTPDDDAELYSHDLRPAPAPSTSRTFRGRADSIASASSIEPRQGDFHGPTSWSRGGQVNSPHTPALVHQADQQAALDRNTNTANGDLNGNSDALSDNFGRCQDDGYGKGEGQAQPPSVSTDADEAQVARSCPEQSSPTLPPENEKPPTLSPTKPHRTTFTPLPPTPLSPTTLPATSCPHCQATGSLTVTCATCSDDRIVAIYCIHCLESGHYKLSCKRCWGTRIVARFCGICDEDRREELRCVCVGGEVVIREKRGRREGREDGLREGDGVTEAGGQNERGEREQDGGVVLSEGDEAWDGDEDEDEESGWETEDEEREEGSGGEDD